MLFYLFVVHYQASKNPLPTATGTIPNEKQHGKNSIFRESLSPEACNALIQWQVF